MSTGSNLILPIRVFLADDHAVVRDGLRLLLEKEDDISVVGEAADGRQTVQQVQRICPDVVVMDIAMPELNGTEATRQIRETCPSTQVVILSMHASSEHIFQALKAGAQGYVFKESAGKEVVDAVRNVRAGRRYISQRIAEQVVDDYMLQRESAPGKSPLDRLSPREREIVQLVAEGKSSATIADILHLSPKTVDTYRSRLMQALNLNDISGLVKFAIQHGLIPLELVQCTLLADISQKFPTRNLKLSRQTHIEYKRIVMKTGLSEFDERALPFSQSIFSFHGLTGYNICDCGLRRSARAGKQTKKGGVQCK